MNLIRRLSQMKNRFFLIIIFAFIVHGFVFPIVNFKAGIEKAGLSFSFEGNEEWGKARGIRIGAGFSSLYERRFVFQPELYYVQKGAQISGNYIDKELVQKIELEYLELPLLFRYAIIRKEKINIGFLFGPFMASKLNASQITTYDSDKRTDDVNADFKKTDFGTVFGLELVLIKKKFNLFLDIRLTSGLTDIRENRSYNESTKTRSFSILAGIGF